MLPFGCKHLVQHFPAETCLQFQASNEHESLSIYVCTCACTLCQGAFHNACTRQLQVYQCVHHVIANASQTDLHKLFLSGSPKAVITLVS